MTRRRVVIEDDIPSEGDIDREGNLLRARALLARLGPSARAIAPGSAAEKHASEFGHALSLGCCVPTPQNVAQRADIDSPLWTTGKAV